MVEGVKTGDLLWSAPFNEDVVAVRSLDGVELVTGNGHSEIWEIPTPEPNRTIWDFINNWVLVVTVLCVMSYFFFSFKRRGPAIVAASNLGRYLLMIGFGAFFGNTVMTGMSFLLDRLMFLIDDWLKPFYHHLFRWQSVGRKEKVSRSSRPIRSHQVRLCKLVSAP